MNSSGYLKVKGTVKWFNEHKGYGFIHHNNKDYFVHFKEIRCEGFKTLPEGARVRFTIAKSDKGDIAKDVTFENNLND